MWKKCGRAGQATDDNIIRRMGFACWIPKAINTHSEYVILYCFSTVTMVAWTRLDITLYVNCRLCSVLNLAVNTWQWQPAIRRLIIQCSCRINKEYTSLRASHSCFHCKFNNETITDLQDVYQLMKRTAETPALYSGRPGFVSRSGSPLRWLGYSAIFLSPSRQISLELRPIRFLPRPLYHCSLINRHLTPPSPSYSQMFSCIDVQS